MSGTVPAMNDSEGISEANLECKVNNWTPSVQLSMPPWRFPLSRDNGYHRLVLWGNTGNRDTQGMSMRMV